MKLLFENWQKYLEEDNQPQKVIAYHSSNKKHDTFSIDYADKGSHSGAGLYFASIPEGTMPNRRYLYNVELTLIKGAQQLPSEPVPRLEALIEEGYNYTYDPDVYHWSDDEDDDKEFTAYRMLRDEDISILEVNVNK